MASSASLTASLSCFRILEDIIEERGEFNLISGQKRKKRKGNFFPLPWSSLQLPGNISLSSSIFHPPHFSR